MIQRKPYHENTTQQANFVRITYNIIQTEENRKLSASGPPCAHLGFVGLQILQLLVVLEDFSQTFEPCCLRKLCPWSQKHHDPAKQGEANFVCMRITETQDLVAITVSRTYPVYKNINQARNLRIANGTFQRSLPVFLVQIFVKF